MSHNIVIAAVKQQKVVEFSTYQTPTKVTQLIMQQNKNNRLDKYKIWVLESYSDIDHIEQLDKFIAIYTLSKYRIQVESN